MRTLEKYANLNLLWIFPIIVPLGTILLSFYLQEWYWGLMDDATILGMGRNFAERFANDYGARGFAAGRMQFTFSLRSAIFYSWFDHTPVILHLLKWAEACLMLLVWSIAVRKISGNQLAALIFPAVALSFHYLYDTFFFISTHEVLGLLFWGLALNCYLTAMETEPQFSFVYTSIAGLLFTTLAITTKEPMAAVGVALGLGFIVLYLANILISRRALMIGATLFSGSLGYLVLLKFFIQPSRGHVSSYSLTNLSRILGNLTVWVNKDLFNHSPWLITVIVIGFALWGNMSKRRPLSAFTAWQVWGMLMGVLLYSAYTLIILPWNTAAYYSGPLGVFFAIPVAIFAAQLLPHTSVSLQILVPIASLLFNMLVSQWALTRESLYHYDTQNLMIWIRGNPEFQLAADGGLVYCNAMEGGGAIPAHLERDFGVLIPGFTYKGLDQSSFRAGQIMVYTPRFGSDTDTFSPDLWETQFYSKFWQVYVHK